MLSYPYTLSQRQAEYATVVDITGHFKTQEIEHTALIGADYYRFNSRDANQTTSMPASVSLFGAPVAPPTVYRLRVTQPLPPSNTPTTWAPIFRIR